MLMRAGEVALTLGISESTVRDIIRDGGILPRGGRYPFEEVQALATSRATGRRVDSELTEEGDPLASMAAREARAQRSPPPPDGTTPVGDEETTPALVNLAQLRTSDLGLMRARTRFANDAMEALKTSGQLVVRKRVEEHMRRHLRDVNEAVRKIPQGYAAAVAEYLGVSPAKAERALRIVADGVTSELRNRDIVGVLSRDLDDEDDLPLRRR